MDDNTKKLVIGRKIHELEFLNSINFGEYYPILDSDNITIIDIYSAYEGTPDGYKLSKELQAFVEKK